MFVIIDFSCIKIKNAYLDLQNKREIKTKENVNQILESEEKEIKQNQDEKNKGKVTSNKTKNIWQVEIPKINLVATIEEGTSEEIMNKYVGHFEITEKWNGNVGLAAHNRRLSC